MDIPPEPSEANMASGSEHLPSAARLPQKPRNSMNTSSALASRPRTGAPHVETTAASLDIPPSLPVDQSKPSSGPSSKGRGTMRHNPLVMAATWEHFER